MRKYKNQWLNLDTCIAYLKFGKNLEEVKLCLYDNKVRLQTILYGKKDVWNHISQNSSTFDSEECIYFEKIFLEGV